MKISALMIGLVLSLNFLPLAVFGYNIFIPEASKEKTAVFDSSLRLHGCLYHLKTEDCRNAPLQFTVDKNTGLVWASAYHNKTESAKGREFVCPLSVVVRGCDHLSEVEIPVYVRMVPLGDLTWVPTTLTDFSNRALNISVRIAPQRIVPESSWVDIFPSVSVESILPSSLLSCSSRTRLMHKHYKSFRLENGAILVRKSTISGRKSHVITLAQSIKHCPITDNRNTIIPNQEVVVSISLSSQPVFSNQQSDIITGVFIDETLAQSVPKRRKRSYRTSLHFIPKMKIVEISENLKSCTHVVALNLNNPNNIPVVFSWHPTTDKRSLDAFSLDPNTGVVMTKRPLDRENVASHTFRVTASGRGQTDDCTLMINIKDMNDNVPRFEKREYRFHLGEDEYVATYVGKVTATDDDAGENKKIRYSIEDLEPRNMFSISEYGEITLGSELDRERTAQYSFNVVATDSGTLPQRSTAIVVVTIDDVNDVTPIFRKCQNVRIGEDTKSGTKIATVAATDPDAGINGKVIYSLVTSQDRNFFSINRENGEITVISDISFERHPHGFRLRVRAQDGGRPPRSSYCEVVVNIIDINDNAPTFISPPYEAIVSEDIALRSEILQVKAVDPDSGDNARITYSFLTPPRNLPFVINGNTGQIALSKKLDYEQTTLYHLDVRAVDHGVPSKSSVARVTIKVRNVNDNAPKFKTSIYHASVSETAKLGKEIIAVIANDPDQGTTLHYRIISGDPSRQFGLITRNKQGIITLAQKLDFNRRRSYILSVMCSDGTRSSTAQVRINVTDANTNKPQFDKSTYEKTVAENVPIGTTVLQVHATDADDGQNAEITYSLVTASREFSVNPKTGDIKTKITLDYDTETQLYFTVLAKDNGIPPQQTETLVTIYLEDVNDNAPVFDQPKYSASVSEDERIGTIVNRIHATDKDFGKNGQILYTFEGGDDGSGYFSIDQSSGVIRTVLQLDREHIAEYELIAVAKDRGLPAKQTSVSVIVSVLDVNDNPPHFPADEITFYVPEDSPVGSIIAKLHAVDPDTGEFRVLYEIASVEAMNLWDLNYETGELSPAFTLDYEKQANYTLQVQASSTNQLLSQVKVNINLIDVNDNPPVLNDFQIIFNNYRTHKPYTFPFGPIGKIPAYDPDVTSVLRYRFTAGNDNNLLILNELTGELRLSSKLDNDREFTATFMVEASDGKYNVSRKCVLKVVPITDEMLTNSVTVRVQEMSQEDFLSNAMKQFTNGLGQILNVSTQDVFIFNVQNDTDVTPHAVVNVSFSAKHPAGHFFTTQHLQEQVYLNRSVLTNYSMQNVMPFDDNICLREPCENYMRCVSALYFNSSAPFVSTNTILFRPIHPVSGLRCKCPDGFAGHRCENEVNLCHPTNCKNGGKCLSVEGGYVCECNGTFAGRHCEVNLVGSQCDEAQDICKNGAQCQSYPAGGLGCDCRQGGLVSQEMTSFCELRTRSFRKGDFTMFSGITRQWRFTLSLSFAAREKSGLLLYNGRFNHEHDYLAMEIVNGQVQLNFSTGQNYTVVSPYISGGVSDGKWHTVEVKYRNKPKREILGKGHTGPSNVKVVTVTIDPETCDPAISAKWPRNLGKYTCSKTAEQGGTKSSLDLTTPLLIGGVPNLPEAYQVRSRYFVGCIRDLQINHRLVDMSSYVANHGSQPGCSALHEHCKGSPCSRGSCENVWGMYKCNCDGDYGGKRCERIQPVYHLQGYGCLKHQQASTIPQFTSLPWTHTVAIRTTRMNGTVLYMEAGSTTEIELSLQGGKVSYSVKMARIERHNQVDVAVNDGGWHEVGVTWRKIGERISVEISIDEDFGKDDFVISDIPATFSQSRITALYLGGRWATSRVENAFFGCIRGLDFETPAIHKNIPEGSLKPTPRAKVEKGCRVSDPCQNNNCPVHSDCIPNFDAYSCKCHKGYVGDKCGSVCLLHPCENGGTCRLSASEPYGYKCQCSCESYYGRICELEHVLPCPFGWWGDLICTPCNCEVERNFYPNCNDNGGKCRCKKNNYYSSAKDMCLPCNCYHVGSTGLGCDDETGQCQCKATVVGKNCNMCSSNFAEVQDKGCSVQYGMCPQVFVNDITWRRAEFGDKVLAQCPKNAVGLATRVCNEEQGWLKPVLGNCTGLPYHDLEGDLKNLLGNPEYLQEHSIRMSMDAVTRLYAASNETEKLYQGDILMSYKLITKILSTQNSLSGFDLTASRRKDFNKYLIESTSHSLNSENHGYWKALLENTNRGENSPNVANPAKLLQSYEEYVSTLTNNMNSMLYPSITEISPNVKLHIQPVSNGKEERVDLRESEPGVAHRSLVSVTLLLPDSGDRSNLPSNGTLGVIEFSTLGEVLPMKFHDSRLDMRRPQKGFINSAVATVVVHNRANRTSRSNRDLILLTFTTLREGGSNPQCVFWNFTARSDTPYGGWSQKGCSLKKSNKTHITCSCSHLTSFAIVSDEEVVSVLEELPVKIILYASVAVILLCILACLGVSFFLEDVKSNHAKIHNNFGISVFCSEICFAAGITQTSNTYACMAIAIFIHFFFMSTLAWVFVEGLHLYRMLKEQRNVDRGNMRVYYLIGWGVPAMITALSVGLDAKGFGNANFCWIRTDHLLVWSFAGPLLICAIVYVLIFCMTLGKYFTSRLTDMKRSDVRANLRSSFILLPVVGALWALALFAVNENKTQFYYLFSLVNIILGVLLLLLHCIFNKEVRDAIRTVKERRWQRAELSTTKQHLLVRSIQTPDIGNGPRRVDIATSASSTSTTNTANRRNNHQDSSMFHDMSDLDVSDDSESDLSDSLISLASTHSSDEDDADDKPTYLNVNNSNNWQYKNGHLPVRKSRESPLLVHSTPKDIDDDYHPPPHNGSSSSKSDMFRTTLPTVEESTHEHEQNEEPHYLAINSLRKETAKSKEEKIEMIPLQDMDSLPRKGILKNGRRSKSPTPARTDSLQRTHSPMTTGKISNETNIMKKKETIEKVAVIRNSPQPSEQDQLL